MIEMGSTRPDLRSKGMFSTMCHEENSGWDCRSERGHTGPHVSLDGTDQVMWIWEWEDSLPEEVEVTPEVLRAVADYVDSPEDGVAFVLRVLANKMETPRTPGMVVHDAYMEASGARDEDPWVDCDEKDRSHWEAAATALLASEFRT